MVRVKCRRAHHAAPIGFPRGCYGTRRAFWCGIVQGPCQGFAGIARPRAPLPGIGDRARCTRAMRIALFLRVSGAGAGDALAPPLNRRGVAHAPLAPRSARVDSLEHDILAVRRASARHVDPLRHHGPEAMRRRVRVRRRWRRDRPVTGSMLGQIAQPCLRAAPRPAATDAHFAPRFPAGLAGCTLG
jgi:hypothetical protein